MVSILKNGRLLADFVSHASALCFAVQECNEGDTVEVIDDTDPYLYRATTFCHIGGKVLSWEDTDDSWEMQDYLPAGRRDLRDLRAEPEVFDPRLHTRSHNVMIGSISELKEVNHVLGARRGSKGAWSGHSHLKRQVRRADRRISKQLIKEQMEAA